MIAPTLSTQRLILRPISMDDWEDYAASWADPRMTAFIGGTPRDRTTSWSKFLQGAGLWPVLGYGYWSFADRETGRYLGNGGLSQFERGIAELEDQIEAGWAFIPDAWGRGYATEAMTAALAWADDHLHREVRCIIDHDNLASMRVATKLGFTQFAVADFPPKQVTVWQRHSAQS
jgi:RimJ/RimL family protein N-acetyltransferase